MGENVGIGGESVCEWPQLGLLSSAGDAAVWGLENTIFFESCIDMIPSNQYISEMEEESQWGLQKGTKGRNVTQQMIAAFDPCSTSVLYKKLVAKRQNTTGAQKGAKGKAKSGSAKKDERRSKKNQTTRNNKQKTSKSKDGDDVSSQHDVNSMSTSDGRPSRRELLSRLHAKIDALRQGKRKSPPLDLSELKREGVELKKRRRDSSNKSVNTTGRKEAFGTSDDKEVKGDRGDVDGASSDGKSQKRQLKEIADDDVIEFGRVNFDDGPKREPTEYNEAEAKKGAKGKRLREGIKALKKEQEKLDSLPEHERQKTEQDILMDRAIQKASGERVLDNLKKLKERQKSLLNRKKTSKRKWAERLKAQDEDQAKQAAKRKDALNERRERKRLNLARKGKLNFFNLATTTDSGQAEQDLNKWLHSQKKQKAVRETKTSAAHTTPPMNLSSGRPTRPGF